MITEAILEESVDRVIGGPRRKSRIISEHEKKITAYHEGGHTLAAWAMPDIEPVYKVTILARGRTGGHAMTVPEDDKGLMTRSEMIARLVMAMGGRAAEELVFREPTTGASSDIDQATKIARAMVTEYGMSAKLGAVRYGQEQGDPFLGRSMGVQSDYSHEVAREIDEEVRNLIEAAHTEAWAILNEYRDALDVLAGELLEHETLTRKDLDRILADVKKRPRITTFNDFGDRVRPTSRRSRRPPSSRPSVASRGRRTAVADEAGASAPAVSGPGRGARSRRLPARRAAAVPAGERLPPAPTAAATPTAVAAGPGLRAASGLPADGSVSGWSAARDASGLRCSRRMVGSRLAAARADPAGTAGSRAAGPRTASGIRISAGPSGAEPPELRTAQLRTTGPGNAEFRASAGAARRRPSVGLRRRRCGRCAPW